MDIHVITSEFLIYNIDKAFDNWSKPMTQHLSFEEFCETLLPYKNTELQSLDYWRDSLVAKFTYKMKYPHNIEYNATPYIHYQNMLKTLKSSTRISISLETSNFYRPLSASNIDDIRRGTCANYIDFISSVARAHGIPIYRESFPQWGKTNNVGHSFLTVVNKHQINLPFRESWTWNYGLGLRQEMNIPKVYRTTYAINEQREKYYAESNYISPQIVLFQHDITSDYYSTSTVELNIETIDLQDQYVYLSFFSNGDWEVLDCAKRKKDFVRFENVGRNNLYIIQGYNGDKLIEITSPFILQLNGTVQFIDPELARPQAITLRRKYWTKNSLYDLTQRAVGVIEASSDPSFSIVDTVCDILNPGQFKYIKLEKAYQYWRFVPRDSSTCNIAELQFYVSDTIVKGDIMTNIATVDQNQVAFNAFDGDWLTNVHSISPIGSWVGLNLGQAYFIEKVLCVPRVDDNNIHIGDEYELRYWDGAQWKLIQRKIAQDSPLVFDSVPKNALLVLDNITRGSQIRPFTYENDQQVWW